MGDLCIFCSLPQFLSLIVYFFFTFSHLCLFLGILFFVQAIINGMIFLYSFLICSLLVYIKDVGFRRLILYLATLLKLFMVSKRFFVEFFTSFRYQNMSANGNSLTTSYPICIPFMSSSCLLCLRIPRLCWIRVARVNTLFLFLTLEELFQFFPI
jgi:hypothetical protein